jgi:hypothetical protein
MLVGIGIDASQSHPTTLVTLTIEDLHDALLAILLAQQSTLTAVAHAPAATELTGAHPDGRCAQGPAAELGGSSEDAREGWH